MTTQQLSHRHFVFHYTSNGYRFQTYLYPIIEKCPTNNEVMTEKEKLVSNFDVEKTIEAFYTGGSVAITADAKWLFACRNNIVSVLNVETGQRRYALLE